MAIEKLLYDGAIVIEVVGLRKCATGESGVFYIRSHLACYSSILLEDSRKDNSMQLYWALALTLIDKIRNM